MLKRSADLGCSWACVIAVVNGVDSSNGDSITSGLGTVWAWPGARAGGR